MSDLEDDLIFDGGINGIDCAKFVRYIRRKTMANGTQRDDQLVAETAAACLDGDALLWFEDDLESETQDSWKLLRRALLQRWPPGLVPSVIPAANVPAPAPVASPSFTPAAAPPVLAATLTSHERIRGRIRVVTENDRSPLGYLARNMTVTGGFRASLHTEEAQVVSLRVSCEPINVYLDGTPESHLRLGVTFGRQFGKTPEALYDRLHTGSVVWGGLTALSSSGSGQTLLQTSSTHYHGQSVSSIWYILLDGEILLMCKVRPSSFSRFEIAVRDKTGTISITNDEEERLKANEEWQGQNCRFIFESIS